MAKPTARGAKSLALATTGNNEVPDQMKVRTGLITAVDKTTTPWTVTVRLSEKDIPGITMLGWYDPVIGDVVQVMEQGPLRLVLGTLAPGKVYMPPAPPPAPPAPPAAPPAEVPVRTVPVSATSAGTSPAEAPTGGVGTWRSDALYQTGGRLAQRGFWFYGTKIADVKGAGTILGGSIFIQRLNTAHGPGAGANVRLGWHTFTAQPGGNPGPHSSVTVVGQLGRGAGNTFVIPQPMIDAMNAGTLKGFGLEPGSLGYTSADYMISPGYGPGQEWSGALELTIRG